MPKSYGEGCLAAHALDLIGDRWTLLVARELMLGPKRFGAIRAGVPGIATNMLAGRLEEMVAAGLLTRETLPPPASVVVYGLTEAGEGLWPILKALCDWGVRQPGHDPRLFISPTALMLSMRAIADRGGAPMAAGFSMGGERFEVRLGSGAYAVRRAAGPCGDLQFQGTANGLAALVYGSARVSDAVEAGLGRVEGDLGLAQQFVDRFHLPR
ncbi:helix-turn-helix domain-containing protein [Frigidibacter sp. RF13]|uniref:winged helix-turn-helix transcriptional regulator n=1 Tax=Frigidibacter sp. RF13 TaxID=2997340 RepID=UPI00226FA84A|nr:helix-turn-helix domain-containing protein [Frigidibacter sp. RF13]MCY1128234.1 helix-turn-helix domain-containing protein [Frigidibacter sp. RF13]